MSNILAIGLLFALFLPGFFITYIFFREVKLLERIVLSIAFSIMIAVAIGISLGYNENVKNITGGINQQNVWLWELVVTSLLGSMAWFVNRKQINLKRIKDFRQGLKSIIKKISRKKEEVKHKEL